MDGLNKARERRRWKVPLTSPVHPQNATAMYHIQLTETIGASSKNVAQSFDTPPHSSNAPWPSFSANLSYRTQLESVIVDGGRYGMEWTRGAYDTSRPISDTTAASTASTRYPAPMNDYSEPFPQQSLPLHCGMDSSSRTESFLTPSNESHAATATSNVGFSCGASQPAAEDYIENDQLQRQGEISSGGPLPQPPLYDGPYQPPQCSKNSRSWEPGLNTSMLPLPQSSYQISWPEPTRLSEPFDTSTQTLSVPLYDHTYNTNSFPADTWQFVDDDSKFGNTDTPNMAKLYSNSSFGSSTASTCYYCGLPLDDADSRYAHMRREHANMMGPWPQGKCPWDKCDCRQFFKTPKKWLQHVDQRHEKKVWCPEQGCNVGPFGSKADLKRHRQSIHEAPTRCPHPFCKGHKGKLNRRDKRNEHQLRYHGTFFCTVADCLRKHIQGVDYGFSSQSDLNKHTIKHHASLGWRIYPKNIIPTK